MFSAIKNFLVKWDIWPILYPVREDGFLQALPLAFMGGKALIDYFGGKKKASAEDASREAFNQFLDLEEGKRQELLAAMGGGDPAAGLQKMLSGVSSQAGTSSSQGTSTTRTNMRTMPEWAKNNQAVVDRMRGLIQGRLGESSTRGTGARTARQVAAVNRAMAGALGADRLRSAVTGARPDATIDAARAAQIGDIAAGAEDAARARRTEDLSIADRFAALTRGQHQKGISTTDSTQTGTTTGTSTDPTRGFASAWNVLRPSDPRAPQQTGMTPGLDAASGLTSALAGFDWSKMFGGK